MLARTGRNSVIETVAIGRNRLQSDFYPLALKRIAPLPGL